jgi:hypothetical protein
MKLTDQDGGSQTGPTNVQTATGNDDEGKKNSTMEPGSSSGENNFNDPAKITMQD